MANLTQQGDTFIESNEPANAGYGQNGDKSPSSSYTAGKTKRPPDGSYQTRKVDASPIAASHGMKGAATMGTVPPNARPVTRKI